MSELAAAPAPAADDDPLKGEPTPESQQDVIRIFNGFKRDAQMIISKVSELEYEIGEHELVVANARELPDDRNAYRLVGGVLVKTTVGDALPKVQQNMANIRATIDKLKVALASVNAKSAAWKEKYGIKTQQEMELEKRNAQASGGAVKAATFSRHTYGYVVRGAQSIVTMRGRMTVSRCVSGWQGPYTLVLLRFTSKYPSY